VSTQYSLTVTNNSTQFQDLCIYQKAVDLGVPNALSLAWLTAPAWPNTTVQFTWSLDYSFVWSQTGVLKPGVTFDAQQIAPADPDNLNANQILFDYRNGAFTFTPGNASGTAQLGSLYIRELSTIPTAAATVGIGMSNAGVFAVQAEPNMNLVFTPHPSYWVSAGTFQQGQVLDIEQITNEQEVDYNGTFNMTAVLDATNLWTVKSGN
jgi:rhizosphere induced protein